MTTQTEPESPSPRQMTCVRRFYVMQDEHGGTWLAAEEDPGPQEGGAMSHRGAGDGDGDAVDQPGGAMSHLLPGETAEVEGDDADQVTLLVPPRAGGMPHRLQAYRVSPALLPTGSDPAAG